MDQAGDGTGRVPAERDGAAADRADGSLYNLVHDEAVRDEDIVRLREIHVEIDEAVREAYALDEEREPAIREYEARVASAPLPSVAGD